MNGIITTFDTNNQYLVVSNSTETTETTGDSTGDSTGDTTGATTETTQDGTEGTGESDKTVNTEEYSDTTSDTTTDTEQSSEGTIEPSALPPDAPDDGGDDLSDDCVVDPETGLADCSSLTEPETTLTEVVLSDEQFQFVQQMQETQIEMYAQQQFTFNVLLPLIAVIVLFWWFLNQFLRRY